MVTLRQDNGEDYCSSTKNGYIDPREVREVIAIQRNKFGQIYKLPDLNKSVHFSCSLSLLQEIHHRLQFLNGNDNIPLTVIPSSTLLHHHNGIFVKNGKADSSIDILSKSKKFLHESVSQHNLLRDMKLIKDSANRKSPCLSFGWTKTNCNAYKTTRTNMFQNTKPSIILGDFNKLSSKAKATLMLSVCEALSSCSELDNAFDIPLNDPVRNEFSKVFSGMWESSIQDYLRSPNFELPNFKFEAFTVMIPIVLGPHRDKLNDYLRQMSNVVQINVSLPIDDLPDCQLKTWIRNLLGPDAVLFPLSIILYSRKVVRETTDRMMIQRSFKASESPMAGYSVGNLRKYFYNVMWDVSSNRNYETSLDHDFNINFESVSRAIMVYENRQKILTDSIYDGSYGNKLFAKISSPKLLESFGITSCYVQPVYEKIYEGCDHNSSKRVVKELHDFIFFKKKETKVLFRKNLKLKFNFVRRGHNKEIREGPIFDFDDKTWRTFKDGFVENFGDGRYLGSVTLSLLDSLFRVDRSPKKPMSYRINNKPFLSYCVRNVIHKHSKFLVQKPEIRQCKFLHQRLCELHNITTGSETCERPSEYSYHCLQDNMNPLTIVPDYEYTFNGPVIRLPASYDKEVC